MVTKIEFTSSNFIQLKKSQKKYVPEIVFHIYFVQLSSIRKPFLTTTKTHCTKKSHTNVIYLFSTNFYQDNFIFNKKKLLTLRKNWQNIFKDKKKSIYIYI